MSRALKITGIVLGSLIALFIVAIGVLLLVIDPNDYKPQLAAVVKDKTGMELTIQDRLEWALWPNIGVKLGRASLSDPESRETLVAVNLARVSVELLPLLKKQIEIDAVQLDGARVRYVQYADSRTSWDRLIEQLASEPPQPEEPSQAVAFNIDRLEVSNSAVYLVDQAAGVERALEAVAIEATGVAMQEPFPLTAAFTFRQQDAEGKTVVAKNTLETTITLNQDQQQYSFSPLAFTSALSGTALPAPAEVKLQGAVRADMAAETVTATGLALQANYQAPALKAPATVTLSANVAANLAQSQLNVSQLQARASWPDAARPQPLSAALAGSLSTNWATGALDASQLAVNAVVPDASYPQPLQVSLKLPLTGNWKEGKFSLPQFALQAAGLQAQGALEASLPALQAPPEDAPAPTEEPPITRGMNLSGKLAVAPFNPRQLMAALGIEPPKTQDANVLKSASLNADISGNDQQVLLKNLRLKLDDTTITGEAGISNLDTLRQYARLSLDRMNVDRYLGPDEPAAAPNAQTTPPAATPPAAEGVLPVALLKSQNLDVAVNAGSLKLLDYPISNFRIAATAADGVVNVSELRGNIYQGGFSAPASINVQGAQPVLKLQPRLNGMEIGPLADKLLKKDLLEGRASFTGDLTLRGNTTDAWMKSVSGSSDFKFENGVLHGVNAMRQLNEALGKYSQLLALAGKDLAVEAEKQRDTEIASFAASNTLESGVVKSKSLNADLRKAKVAGDGSFNLATQELDYRFGLTLDKSVAGGRYANYTLPVQCRGSLSGNLASLCKLDSKAVADMALKAAAGKQLEKLGVPGGDVDAAVKQRAEAEKQKAKEKLNEEVGKGLQKLFGR